MRVPTTPRPLAIARLSYSQYEAGLRCLARLAWTADRNRPPMPSAGGALLGTAFHSVMRDANEGRLGQNGEVARDAARVAFDDIVAEGWRRAHPLLRLKFSEPTRLPFYNARREQTAALAARTAERSSRPTSPGSGSAVAPRVHGSERWLESADGLLVGRADYVDRRAKAILDYKSGRPPEGGAAHVSPSETRQLSFYAHLAVENGAAITRGVIVRGDGPRVEVTISPEAAAREGERARALLNRYNAAAATGASHNLASPSAEACAHCECMPSCDPFWGAASPTWADVCGHHVEGLVKECEELNVYGARLVRLQIARTHGTNASSVVELEQMPAEWLEVDGSALPSVGSVVRVVHARPDRKRHGVFRADKAATEVWQT